jgi:hypothetical protein
MEHQNEELKQIFISWEGRTPYCNRWGSVPKRGDLLNGGMVKTILPHPTRPEQVCVIVGKENH